MCGLQAATAETWVCKLTLLAVLFIARLKTAFAFPLKETTMKHNLNPQEKKEASHTGKVENDTNKPGKQNPTQLNQGKRTPDSRSDREAHVGGSNQSQSRRGPAGTPKR